MTMILDYLELAGAASVQLLWLPVLVWTLFWLISEACLRACRDVHPAVRYRVAQAVLLALPGGILLSAFWDVSFLIPAVTVVQLIPEVPAVLPLPGVVPFEVPVASSAEVTAAAQSISLGAALGLGLVGAVLLAALRLVRLGAHAHALRRMRGGLEPIVVPGLEQDVRAVVAQLGLEREVTVVVTAADVVPMTFGLLRPFVVLPASLSAEERRLALAHELVHVRHRDYSAQWLEALVGAVFAFHPAVHRLRQRCHLLREMACDATLLAEASVSRRSYASLVYSFVTPEAIAQPIGVSMADSRPHLHQRFTAMLSYRTDSQVNPYRASWLLASAVLAFGCLFLTATQVLGQERPVTVISLQSENPTPAQQAVRDAMTRLSEAREQGEDVTDPQAALREAVTRLAIEDGAAVTLDPAQTSVFFLDQEGTIAAGEAGARLLRQGEVAERMIYRLVENMDALSVARDTLRARTIYRAVREQGEGSEIIALNPTALRGEDGARIQMAIREAVSMGEGQGLHAANRLALTQETRAGVTQERTIIMLRSATGTVDGISGTGVSGRQALVRLHEGEVANGPRPLLLLNGSVVEGLSPAELSPGSIENIEVLRAEAARARFGEAGANGAVLITLKAGEVTAGVTAPEAAPVQDGTPADFAVHGAYPNPSSSTVTVDFSLPETADVHVELFDMVGRRVLSTPTQTLGQGARHTISLDGSGLAAGAYTYRLVARTDAETHTATGSVTLFR